MFQCARSIARNLKFGTVDQGITFSLGESLHVLISHQKIFSAFLFTFAHRIESMMQFASLQLTFLRKEPKTQYQCTHNDLDFLFQNTYHISLKVNLNYGMDS